MKQPPNSLAVLLKQAETMFTSNKSNKFITLEDIEALAGFLEKGSKFLENKVANLVPVNNRNKSGNNTYYNSNVIKSNNFIPNKQQAVQETPLLISGDIQGTNFVTEASISLYDPTADIEQQVNQSKQELAEQATDELIDEVDVLNNIFESLENAQE